MKSKLQSSRREVRESQTVRVDTIEPNPDNPRKIFDPEALEQLAQSIREVGIISPPVVKRSETEPEQYRLICGERRWRAAQLAGLETIPVIIQETLTTEQEAEIMLIENLQREDLDPIEEARAYQKLLKEHSYTQEALGEKLSVSQAQIANRLRLLELPESVKENISRGIISPSHGKILAGYKSLPKTVIEKAAKAIAEEQVPVAKTADAISRVIGDEGRPLFNDYGNGKPDFETDQCEQCESRVIGKRYGNEVPFCIKPSCWDKKQRQTKQAREKALAEQVKKAAQKGQGVVNLEKFQYDQYELLDGYNAKGIDLAGCGDCEHKKVAKPSYKDELVETCFQPSCFRKKKAVAAREKSKEEKSVLEREFDQIAVLAGLKAQTLIRQRSTALPAVGLDKQALVYLAGVVLASVGALYDRKITRYQYLKDRFGWTDEALKKGDYQLLGSDWDTYCGLLETLSEQRLMELILEWPAVAHGLDGGPGWIFEQMELPDEESTQAPTQRKSYANSSKEIPLPTFAKRAGLPAAKVRKMAEKGEIKSRESYKHRLIPESELEKVLV